MKHSITKVRKGQYQYRGFTITFHGYYPPDKCIWWEAVDDKTGNGDFHEHTKRDILKAIDEALHKEALKYR